VGYSHDAKEQGSKQKARKKDNAEAQRTLRFAEKRKEISPQRAQRTLSGRRARD
jgi:hypothetical protein